MNPSTKNELNPAVSRALHDCGALITGGSRGIGAAVADELLARGARVFLCARTGKELESTIENLGKRYGTDRVFGTVVDLERPESISTLFEAAERTFGGSVRILVNNAAIGYAIPFLDTAPEALSREWDRMSAINIRAPLLLAHEFMRRISRAGEKGGAIVNLGSLGGIRGTEKFPGLTPYVATKFAVAGLTESLAVEGRSLGIRVNAVAPGAVDTEMLRKAAPHLKTETTPTDIAKIIAYLADSSSSGAITGTIIEVHSNL